LTPSRIAHQAPADGRYTTAQASAALGVPAATIRRWRREGRIAEAGLLPSRGRKGTEPQWTLAELQPLADEYHARRQRAGHAEGGGS
jgi:hypothetical protein